ncbi:hypothetical protein ACTQ56_04785 [[Clostridium] aminophilum]|uniref:hypothetical protein n=1 Tax=[Clostridium] aminophilum TaxID=1526 RepID=UPI003F95AAC0
MKKIERLLGYLKLDNEEYPFEFVEKEFSVVLYPSTKEKWSELSSPITFFKNLKKRWNRGEHKWIKSFKIEGVTSENYNIVFSVKDSPSNYHGFLSFEVDWYYYYWDSFELNNIGGFRISGAEVDYFYPPQVALENDVRWGDDQRISKMLVSTTDEETERFCGKYSIRRGLQAEIRINALATIRYNTAVNPIDAKSYLYFLFSKPTGLDDLVLAYYHVKCFLQYISYRNNLVIDGIETFYMNENNKRDFAGALVFPDKQTGENDKKASEQILSYYILKNKTSSIFRYIRNGKFGYEHICDSIESRRHYSSARMIMILAEFEREFRDIYGQDCGRSDLYKDTKQAIVDLIEEYRNGHSGDAKKYAGSIKKTVQNLDNSYAQNVEYAIEDCKVIMEPFIKANYGLDLKEVIRNLSDRVGEIRNGIAHRIRVSKGY